MPGSQPQKHTMKFRKSTVIIDHPSRAGVQGACVPQATVGFHNVNLRTFNLRVSNPNKLIVDVFLHDVGFQCARVSAQQKHDEISEVDRNNNKHNNNNDDTNSTKSNTKVPQACLAGPRRGEVYGSASGGAVLYIRAEDISLSLSLYIYIYIYISEGGYYK